MKRFVVPLLQGQGYRLQTGGGIMALINRIKYWHILLIFNIVLFGFVSCNKNIKQKGAISPLTLTDDPEDSYPLKIFDTIIGYVRHQNVKDITINISKKQVSFFSDYRFHFFMGSKEEALNAVLEIGPGRAKIDEADSSAYYQYNYRKITFDYEKDSIIEDIYLDNGQDSLDHPFTSLNFLKGYYCNGNIFYPEDSIKVDVCIKIDSDLIYMNCLIDYWLKDTLFFQKLTYSFPSSDSSFFQLFPAVFLTEGGMVLMFLGQSESPLFFQNPDSYNFRFIILPFSDNFKKLIR